MTLFSIPGTVLKAEVALVAVAQLCLSVFSVNFVNQRRVRLEKLATSFLTI